MDIQSFAENAKVARQLIQMDNNGTMQKIKQNAVASGKIAYNSQGEIVPESFSHFQPSMPSSMNNNVSVQKGISRSGMKLPKEILESMTNEPLEAETISVLDQLNMPVLSEQTTNNATQNLITEQAPVSSGFVDYGMIRMICEETIRKYMGSLKKTIINESKNNNSNLKALKIGESFSFITEDGDIYEAKMEFKGNINKKK